MLPGVCARSRARSRSRLGLSTCKAAPNGRRWLDDWRPVRCPRLTTSARLSASAAERREAGLHQLSSRYLPRASTPVPCMSQIPRLCRHQPPPRIALLCLADHRVGGHWSRHIRGTPGQKPYRNGDPNSRSHHGSPPLRLRPTELRLRAHPRVARSVRSVRRACGYDLYTSVPALAPQPDSACSHLGCTEVRRGGHEEDTRLGARGGAGPRPRRPGFCRGEERRWRPRWVPWRGPRWIPSRWIPSRRLPSLRLYADPVYPDPVYAPAPVYQPRTQLFVAPSIQTQVCYTGGCYYLRGDGVTVAYSWVWVPAAPAAPPAPSAPPGRQGGTMGAAT